MARTLFIRLHPFEPGDLAAAEATWVRVGDEGPRGPGRRGPAADLPRPQPGERVHVCVPATDILITAVQLPRGNRQRLLKAVPYAVEEQLIDDVDELHFALSPREEDGRWRVAVVDRIRISDWLEVLAGAGIQPHLMVPEVLAVPREPGQWAVLVDGERALVRTGTFDGFATELGNLPVMLAGALEENGPPPGGIHLHFPGDGETFRNILAQAHPDVSVTSADYGGDAAGLLAAHLEPAAAINLLQGEYAPEPGWSGQLRPWRTAAVLAVAWLAAQVAVDGYRYLRAGNEAALLQKQMETLYRQAFPDARRVVNPLAQMRNRVRELRQRTGGGRTSLREMLARAAPSLTRNRGVTVRTIRYRQGELDIQVEARDLASIDRLKRDLAGIGEFEVESRSQTRGKTVESRIRIRSRAT